MEKKNIMTREEFKHFETIDAMYDMYLSVVTGFNRLVDICNDSSDRIAELMAKDDINEFKKELQSGEPGELKIQKLSDIVVWADGIIRDAGYNEEKYQSDGLTAYCHVKAHELWRIRDVALKSMERHTVYSNALNKDIADKAAKIELLEKEIEGRKEGYWALKEKMDTQYISIDDHNDVCKAYEKKITKLEKESEKWQDLAKMNRDTICDQYNVCEEFKNKIVELKEEVKKRDKCIMEKNAIINTAAKMKEDDHGKSGFKRYIEHLIEEEERAVPERFKERLNKEITEIFTKEEETVKYRPSEIDRFVNFLKEEVDKKRIVDIRYGVEDDLHVTRELLDTAISLIVAKGYHDYEGVVTGYGRFHVLTAPDVEFKELYDTWKIKSIGSDIPCGEDAIE